LAAGRFTDIDEVTIVKYFKLSQDRRIPYSVLIGDTSRIDGYYESKAGDLSGLPNVIVSYVNPSAANFFPDISDRQIYMVKGAVKEVFDLFLSDLAYKHCCMLEMGTDQYDIYM